MEPTANPSQMLQYIHQPAFLAKDGVIIETNTAASNLQIQTGTNVLTLITQGAEDYEVFTSGKLYLELQQGRAWVSTCDNIHLFCLESLYASPELRAFALAAQHLRLPLSNAVSGTELLMQEDAMQQNVELKRQLGQINRSLYQMIRAICNMSDVSQLGFDSNAKTEFRNVTAIFSEIFEKATVLSEEAERVLKFRNLRSCIESFVDAQLLERMVLNLISNAIKFSPTRSTILATLKQNGNRLSLSVENSIQDGQTGIYGNAFNRFLREPGLDSGQAGIGLGMAVISRIISAHGGTVLLDTVKKNSVKVTVSIPIRTTCENALKSPVILLDGYTGGIDSYLVELSDVLPNHYYESC